MSTRKIDYVYLTSAPHSGSTLIACLLSAHPEISSVGEFGTHFPQTNRCSCGTLYSACPFWHEWAALAGEKKVKFDIGNLEINVGPKHGSLLDSVYYYLFKAKSLNKIRDFLFDCLLPGKSRAIKEKINKSILLSKLLCEKENTRIFLDTTKNPFQIKFLARHPGVRLKVIDLKRDGRAVMCSLLTKEKVYTPKSAIDAWVWANRNLQRTIESNYISPKNVFKLRLEDICENSENVLKQLYYFLEIAPDPVLDFSDKKRFHIVGNDIRHKFNGVIHKHDEKWRDLLSNEDLSLYAKTIKKNSWA